MRPQASAVDPPLTWCGCVTAGGATTGYSGRCSQGRDDFYTQYEALATAICDAVDAEAPAKAKVARGALLFGA